MEELGKILKTWIDVLQGIVTTLGIVGTGIWTYYNFVRGRVFDPHVQITIACKQTVEIEQGLVTIISINIKNTGKTRVDKEECYLECQRLSVGNQNQLEVTDEDHQVKTLDVHDFLEPNEQTEDEVVVILQKSYFYKIDVIFHIPPNLVVAR